MTILGCSNNSNIPIKGSIPKKGGEGGRPKSLHLIKYIFLTNQQKIKKLFFKSLHFEGGRGGVKAILKKVYILIFLGRFPIDSAVVTAGAMEIMYHCSVPRAKVIYGMTLHWGSALNCTALHCTVLHCMVMHCMVLHSCTAVSCSCSLAL